MAFLQGPKLNFKITCQPLCLLSAPCDFRINLLCELESEEPVSIPIKDSIFDHAASSNDLIRVIDWETGEALKFDNVIQNKEPLKACELLTLDPGRSKLCTWATNNEDTLISRFFLDITTSDMKPGRRYRFQYQDHGITKWFRKAEAPENSIDAHGEDPQLIIVSIQQSDHAAFNTSMETPTGPPLQASLNTSCPQLNLSGEPPFMVSIDWKLVGPRRICILMNLDCSKCMGVLVHEPGSRKRRAPQWDTFSDAYDPGKPTQEEETPEFRYGLSDPVLLRIGPGDVARMSCTFTTEDRQGGYIHPDTHFLKSGQTYVMDLRPRRCRWVYEDEIPRAGLSDKQLKELLELLPESRVNSDCSLDLKVVGEHPEQRGKRDYALVGFEFISAEH